MTWPEHPDPDAVARQVVADLAYDDQRRAAAAQAAADFSRHLAGQPSRYQGIVPHLPGWATRFAEAHNRAVSGPDGHYACPHISDGPCVFNVAPWAPGFVCCTSCAEAGLLASLCPPDEKWRCDVCGNDAPNQLHSALIHGQACIIRFGICTACTESEAATR